MVSIISSVPAGTRPVSIVITRSAPRVFRATSTITTPSRWRLVTIASDAPNSEPASRTRDVVFSKRGFTARPPSETLKMSREKERIQRKKRTTGFQRICSALLKVWSGRRDSNPRHRPWQGRTLPAELLPRRLYYLRPSDCRLSNPMVTDPFLRSAPAIWGTKAGVRSRWDQPPHQANRSA